MSEQEQEQTVDDEGGSQADDSTDVQPAEETEAEEAAASEEGEAQEGESVEGAAGSPPALSQKQLEKALDKLDREAERHAKRVVEIMGEDVGMLLDCPMCDPLTPGKIMPTPQTPDRFPAVREFMGDAQPVEWQQDPNTRTCMTCAGYGVVETGSRVEGQERLACTDCGGKGWQGTRAPVAVTGPMAPQPVPESNGPAQKFSIEAEPPEAAALRAQGYTLIPPVGAGS